MKYFSLEFCLFDEDCEVFEKSRIKADTLNKLKPVALIAVVMAAMAVFIDLSFIIAFFAMFITIFIMPVLINRESSKQTRRLSNIIGHEMAVDFHDDHFVVRYLPHGNYKSHTERHLGFDTVSYALEQENYFYFIFSTNNLLIIPKRAMDAEKYAMIKNLIDNFFKDKYSVVK